jgi:FkbM family methyltransferase
VAIFEIGVGPIELCRSRPYWDKFECVLFEPVTAYYEEIIKASKDFINVQVHDIAIYDYTGECILFECGIQSFIQGLNSPYLQLNSNSGITEKSCKCAKISDFDKSDIELLFLDIEGAEWFVLKHLISRPKKIIIEMELFSRYKNPFSKEIQGWMAVNNYQQTGMIGADAIFEFH